MNENNYFVLKVDNDRFKNKTQTETAIPFYAEDGTDPEESGDIWKIYYRHYSTEEKESLLIDVVAPYSADLYLHGGKMYFLINGVKRITVDAFGDFNPDISYACYRINRDILKDICEAETLEIKIEGEKGGGKIIPFNHESLDSLYPTNDAISGQGFVYFSQCFYNSFYESSEFSGALDNYIKYEDERKDRSKKQRKEIEKRIRRINRSGPSAGTIIAIIICVAIIGFLIWGATL